LGFLAWYAVSLDSSGLSVGAGEGEGDGSEGEGEAGRGEGDWLLLALGIEHCADGSLPLLRVVPLGQL